MTPDQVQTHRARSRARFAALPTDRYPISPRSPPASTPTWTPNTSTASTCCFPRSRSPTGRDPAALPLASVISGTATCPSSRAGLRHRREQRAATDRPAGPRASDRSQAAWGRRRRVALTAASRWRGPASSPHNPADARHHPYGGGLWPGAATPRSRILPLYDTANSLLGLPCEVARGAQHNRRMTDDDLDRPEPPSAKAVTALLREARSLSRRADKLGATAAAVDDPRLASSRPRRAPAWSSWCTTSWCWNVR